MQERIVRHRPITVLIAALGGEGGGVLASWLHAAAIASGHYVQGTSVPGVAQRTGATTYYMEIVPHAAARHADEAPPVLALNAAPGEVDLLVASELLEGARAVQAGFVTPDRTTLVASTTRVFTVDEKSAMGDGRLDAARLRELAQRFARTALVADLGAQAQAAGSPISAVLLGAIAACGVLPIDDEAFRAAIRKEGKSVEANLRGFHAGRSTAVAEAPHGPAPAPAGGARPQSGEPVLADVPAEAQDVVREGLQRLADYQDDVYARAYLETVRRFARKPRADGRFVREFARHLALRLSVEDVIRVAQLKLRASRLERVRVEARAAAAEIVDVTEFLKPGPEEILGLLPPGLGRWALSRVRHDRAWPMRVRTTRLSGYLRLRALAALRRWRPRSLRFAEEQAWRARWLSLVERTLDLDAAAAGEVVATAALVRGYADTYKRGLANWTLIMDELVEPMLDGRLERRLMADAVLQARLAASKDPEGETLLATLAAVRRTAGPMHAAAE